VLSGGVTVGEQTFMGVNATTNDHISIGARCVIGSGALLVKNVPDEAVMLSKPAEMSPVPSSKLRGF
jgi:acetyltransferase-like isoleucine patch superfamily enzyme